ncbi:hypothetical protein ACFVUN_30535 [Kitasatospora griseola]|uniref:lipase/acyltransferase domain-containing protein n=1 Tax=Kitasatospora griseola TaxID=2064 RepID=UPI0036D9A43A
MTDLVVVVPGILGSRLFDSDGREVWGLSGRALWRGIRTFGGSVRELELPADLGDEHPGDGVTARGTLPDLHALPGVWSLVDGYSGLLDWLEQNFTLRRRLPDESVATAVNLVEFGYDWRLSCRYNSLRLKQTVDEELTRWQASAPERREARVVLICHSMGGLIARHFVECRGGDEVTRRLITLGTPHRGSLDALLTLARGLRFGPLDLSGFARSLPSLHQLVPDYACLLSDGALLHPGELGGLPGADEAMLRDGRRFHREIREAAQARTDARHLFVPVSGVRQPTPTTAVVEGDGLRALDTIEGLDEGGDGRVPRLSSRSPLARGADLAVRTVTEQHGSLQNNRGVRDIIWGALAPEPPYHRGDGDEELTLGVRAPELLTEGEPYEMVVSVPQRADSDDPGPSLRLTVRAAGPGATATTRTLERLGGGRYRTSVAGLGPGAYRAVVEAPGRRESAVTALLLVIGRDA